MKTSPFFTRPLFLLGLSLLLYLTALALPALAFRIVESQTGAVEALYVMRGIEVTAWGILGLLFLQVPAIAWLANPLYWLACGLFVKRRYGGAIASALFAVVIGFTGTLSAYRFPLPNGSSPFSQLQLVKLLTGFWLWLAAPALLVAIAGSVAYAPRRNRRGPAQKAAKRWPNRDQHHE
jgi:hypothetical protein